MLKNYFKVALRNLLKYKAYSFINVFGLASGIAICLLIFLFIQDELSYDTFHENSDRIYRAVLDGNFGGKEFIIANSPAPMAETLKRDFPEVEDAARIRAYGYPVIRYGDKVFSEERFYWADSNIFNVFTFEFVYGSKENALTEPNAVILTESTAHKYFGNENPVGKLINSDNRRDYMVTAVVKDFPHNSHFHFDFLGALTTRDDSRNPFWLSNNYKTYVLLRKDASFEEFNEKVKTGLVKYYAEQVLQATGIPWEDHLKRGTKYEYYFQPLEDIHLYSQLDDEWEPNSSATYVYIFLIIAIAILSIACINFMNLSTARSAGRAKEVGIRKTLGSTFNQLVKQFLSESVIMSFVAVLIAIALIHLLIPYFNDIASKHLTINYFSSWWIIPGLLLLILFVGFAAGSYPAFFLSSFNPVNVLAGKIKKGAKGGSLRSALVIFQFSVSIVLIIGTIIVYNQLQYIQNKNLGYNKDQLIVIRKTDDIGRSMQAFKDDLLRNPNILNVTNTNDVPGEDFNSNAYEAKNSDVEGTLLLMSFWSDYNFADTYQIEMADGRFYSPDRPVDTLNSIVINEAAAKLFGFGDNAVGKQILEYGRTQETSDIYNIIGVVKDFHFESLHTQIRPLVINLYHPTWFGRNVTARIKTEDLQGTLAYMKETWSKYAGQQAFEYTFFDDYFSKLYENEKRTGKIFTTFSILAILIACLGLLGLAAYTAEQKTKEIGIRKVMGANIGSILFLLSKEFAKWVIIANVIAWPLAYYVMDNWLQNFVYRIDLGWWVFVVSGITALVISILTVSTQALKAAMTDPVKSLRYE